MKHFLWSLIALCCISSTVVKGQDSTAYAWEVTGKKVQDKVYELTFTTTGSNKWQLYGPNESISDVPSVEVELADSSIVVKKPYRESGNSIAFKNPIFDNASFKVYEGPASFTVTVQFNGAVPARLPLSLNFSHWLVAT